MGNTEGQATGTELGKGHRGSVEDIDRNGREKVADDQNTLYTWLQLSRNQRNNNKVPTITQRKLKEALLTLS